MLVSVFYDVNTLCAENTENVSLYLTIHYIIKLKVILIFCSAYLLWLNMEDFISQFCYIYLGSYLQCDKPWQ